MKRFAPRGVRARLCLAFTLTAAVVALGGSLLFVHVVRIGLGNNLDNNLEARAQTIAGVLDGTAPPKLPDPLLIDPSTRAVAQDTVETFAVVRRPDGTILTASGAPAPHLQLPAGLLDLRDGGLARTTIDVDSQAYRVAALAVKRPDGIWLALAGTSRRSNDEALHDLSNALFFALPVLVLMVALGAWVLAGAALRPVERMRRDAAAHGGTGGERLAVPQTGDELARLAVTLNELLGRLGSSLARQQDLVADAGHELRTPLAVLRTELELASRPGRSHEELADAVEHAALEVNRLSQLAEDLLFLARADSSGPLVRPQPTDLAGVLHAAIRSARASADVAGVELSADVAPELTAVIDASAVRRAVDNLLANAIEYATGGPGRSLVQLSAVYGKDLHTLTVTVEDTGPGFPADFLPHAFDRFRRADPARTHNHGQRGAGLGLAVVREIAEAHGGRADACNVPGGGARVSITIPQPIPAGRAAPPVGATI
ncbi:MAG TPA: ATP-binding protein [Frankiaceae bacterium]|nr:ATP-binding protein [Frankiaceae bacterium]